ncbi:MAG TPA: prephenate dehydratase domain-containing protein [Kiritimatiellia bacterium]|nr:prephenate dehydratase domain-containing protein [Kiritimatiellia bacterium]HRU71434.1 prephenate dehydratase domain-containing protein [Kiritimatiellia bacterium]
MDTPVLYLGPEGTHSHEAALRHFGKLSRLLPCLSHFDVVERLCAPSVRPRPLAIVPVENSSEGPVTQTLDVLSLHPEITILEGFSMPVRHHLVAGRALRRLEEIKRVYSHPQALGQCRASLRERVPQAELLAESSTAAAARRAASEPGSAAVATLAAARIHRLGVLVRDLQDSDANVTRFFVITANRRASRTTARRTDEMRSLLYLVIGNRPGALLHALAPFDAAGLNLTFIQSRPLPGRPWEYGFFVEAATDWKAPAAEAAWRLVLALSESGRKLGTYPVR